MVIVVPAFAECEQREQGVIAAVVASDKTPAASAMRQRIDGDGDVEQNDSRDEEAPDQ